jgi:preprotein translocase subunit SecG
VVTTVVLIIHLITAASVVGVIVLQGPKGEGLGAIGGGGARLFHGPRPRETMFLRITSAVAIVFGMTSFYLVFVHFGR